MTDNLNNAADQMASDAKKAAEDAKKAAEDAWNQIKETPSTATEAVNETASGLTDSTQNVVEETKGQVQDTWNQTAGAVEATSAEVKQDMGQTADAAKAAVGEGWTMASEPSIGAASEMKSAAADGWNAASDKMETSAETVKGDAQSTWESAKESTQQEWKKVTDEVAQPNPNDPSTWKQDVYAAADASKSDAGEVIPSWDSYKKTNPESAAPVMPEDTAPNEPVQPVVIPPTTTPFGSQAQMPAVEPAKSYTTQTPAYQPLPVTAKTKKGLPAWAIVLLVIGGLILLCILVLVIFGVGILRSFQQGSIPVQMILSQFLV